MTENYNKIEELIKYLLLSILAALFFIQFGLSLFWKAAGDPVYFHYIAYLVNEHDFVLYRDIFAINPPGMFLFHMAIGKVFGYSYFALTLAYIIWLTVTLVVTWFIMQPFGKVAAFAGCMLFGYMLLSHGKSIILQRDFVAILPIAITLLLVTRRSPNQSINLVHFLLGVFFALGGIFKPHLVIGLPVMAVYNCVRDENSLGSLKPLIKPCVAGGVYAMAGLLLVAIFPIVWLWKTGALHGFWHDFTSFIPIYAGVSWDMRFREGWDRWIYLVKLIITQFDMYWTLFAAAAFGVCLVLKKSGADVTKKLAVTLLLLSIVYIIYVLIGTTAWAYHWLPFNYFVSLCVAMLYFSAPGSNRVRKPNFLPLLAFMAILMTIWRPPIGTQMDNKEVIDDITTYFAENLSPGDKVQTMDWGPGLVGVQSMFNSKAVTATPYTYDFQFYIRVSDPFVQNLRKDFMLKLKQKMPKLILDVHIKPPIRIKIPGARFPEFREFIEQNYEKGLAGKYFDIYRRKD